MKCCEYAPRCVTAKVNLVKLRQHCLKNTTPAYYKFPGACTIKYYKSVIYRKLANFVVSWHLLAGTNTLAYYGVRTLLIYIVFIV
jgi:hypothetical protein